MALKLASAFGGSGTAVAAAAGVVAVAVAGAVSFSMLRTDPGDPTRPVAQDGSETAAPVAPDVAETATDDAAAVQPTRDIVDVPADVLTPVAPRFDVVRVEPDGSAVIAGQAEALADITLRLDGDPVEVARADMGGNFVALLALSPSDTPRLLSLESALDGGAVVSGAETVIIAPFAGPSETPDVVATAPNAPAEGASATASEANRSDVPLAAEPASPVPLAAVDDPDPMPAPDRAVAAPDPDPLGNPPTASDQTEMPAVLIASNDGVRVLQGPGGVPSAQTEVQLDAISYDVDGDVTLAGRGPAAADLRVLLNNQPIQMGEVGPGGDWSLQLPDVDPGTYTLTVEQLAADGRVTSQIDTPFLREDPSRIAESPMLAEAGASVITVQPGFTLWGIAQTNFGDGVLYVSIFEQNRDQIRNPDLIFPGQIFDLPDLPRVPQGE